MVESATSGGRRNRLGIALTALALSLVLAEIGLRVLSNREDLDPYTREMLAARVEPHPYLAYANKPGFSKDATPEDPHQVTHNALGLRGPETTWQKTEGTFRVLCVGGSSTYGFGPSSDLATWPARLEHHLREAYPEMTIEVLNAGCQGWSTHESLINLAFRGVDLRPDVVLVYHSINDVRNALYPGVQHDNTHWRAIWPVERESALQDTLERSYVYLAWRRYLTDWWEQRQNLGSYVIRDFGTYDDDFNQPDGADLGFANFQRNLVSLVQVAVRHGARVGLVTQTMNYADIADAPSHKIQTEGMIRAREIILAVGRDSQVPVIDAAAVLAEAHAAGEPVFTHEVHLQDQGAELLARTIAGEMGKLGLIP